CRGLGTTRASSVRPVTASRNIPHSPQLLAVVIAGAVRPIITAR
ncbi:MAG: hypothetical protein AVDCRST_MAG57-2492, partial [uncultured Blastococcus sp.]